MSTTTGGRSWESRRGALAAVFAVVAAGVAVGFVGVPARAAPNKGSANMLYWPSSPWRTVYGQDLTIEGYVQDQSVSCLGIAHDCDHPAGSVTLYENGRDIPIATATLSPAPGTVEYSNFSMTMRGKQLAPGHYDVGIAYAGDFDPLFWTSTLDVVKNPCTMSVSQSSPSSRPGDPVTFTAGLTGSTFAHPGATITFTDGVGLLASGVVDGNDQVSFSTSALPQGDTTVTASYSGTAVDDACSGSVVHHVDTDPPPVAIDDRYSTDVGVPITVHPMENDFDPGGGAIRADYLSAPDAGDVEAIDNATLVFTPPDGYVGETSMRYVVYDAIGQSSNEAIIHFSFGCTPEANADAYDVSYGQALEVGAPGVTGNDATCDLPTEVTTQPAHGSIVYDTQTGGFTYTPSTGYIGPDAFTYQYAQGLESPVSARVDLFVHTPPTTTTTTSSTSTSSSSSTSSTTTTTPGTSSSSTSSSTSSTSTSTSSSSTSSTSTSTSSTSSTTSTTASTSSTSSTTRPTGAPTITSVDPAHGERGTRVTVVGTGFVPGGTTVSVGGATVPADVQAPAAPLARTQAALGQTLQFTVPDEATAGRTDLTVTTDLGSVVAAAAFTVDQVGATTTSTTSGNPTTTPTSSPPSVSPRPTTATGGTLPYTGADARGPLLLGLALILGGTATLLVRRRLRG